MTLQQLLALPRDSMLTNIAIEYRPTGFIADRVLPPVPVALEAGGYYIFDDSNFNIPDMKRAPRTVYKEIDFGMTSDTYSAEEYGLETRIDRRERKNAPVGVNLEVGKTRRLTNAALLHRERRVANLVTNTANVTQNTTLSGATQWSDPLSSPATVAKNARIAMRAAFGGVANSMVIPPAVFESVRVHPEVIDFLEGGRASVQDLADFFEVGEVIIPGAQYNSAKEGQATVLADLWGKDVLFFFKSGIVSADEPSFGYQFEADSLTIFRYFDVTVSSDIIRINEIRAEKITAVRLAYLVKAAVA